MAGGITLVAYLWHDPTSKHNATYRYTADDVRLWKRMVERNITVPHEFVCITDQPEAFNDGDGIRVMRFDPQTVVPGKMYQQLMPFGPHAETEIGERILTMDLDCAVVGNIDPIVSRDDDLVLWRNPARQPWDRPEGIGANRPLYNGSMMLVKAGTTTAARIWQFLERNSLSWLERQPGDSQNIISAVAGKSCGYWDENDGVYRLARDDTPGSGITGELPENAKVVFFVGSEHKPWRPDVQARHPWIEALRGA